jgi:hypothetical protein
LRLSVDILAGQAGLIALQDDASRGIASEPGSWRIAAAYGISPTVLENLEPLLVDVSRAENKAKADVISIVKAIGSAEVAGNDIAMPTTIALNDSSIVPNIADATPAISKNGSILPLAPVPAAIAQPKAAKKHGAKNIHRLNPKPT